MRFQQRVNGAIVGELEDKDKAIRAARKAALKLNDPRGIIHVEVYKLDDDSIENIHRDLVLAEDIKTLETDLLKPVGLVVFTKHIEQQKKTHSAEPLYKEGDYVILDSELHQIVTVTDSRALAQPVRKKHVTIKDKFADNAGAGRTFTIKRKPIQISPIAANVLTADEVKKELKKIKESENEPINKTSTTSSAESGDTD
jgi:hypothetical protein